MTTSRGAAESEAYYTPPEFHLVERLTLRHVDEEVLGIRQLVVELELRLEQDADARRLLLTFSGVRDFRLLRPWAAVTYLHTLEIKSIRDHQWERLQYRVIDIEEQGLAFWCEEFQVSSIEPPVRSTE